MVRNACFFYLFRLGVVIIREKLPHVTKPTLCVLHEAIEPCLMFYPSACKNLMLGVTFSGSKFERHIKMNLIYRTNNHFSHVPILAALPMEKSNPESRGFETSRDLAVRHLTV